MTPRTLPQSQPTPPRQVEISGVDLFCGAGGLTHGLYRSGVSMLAGVDLDPDCRFPYEANNAATFVEKSVDDLTSEEVAGWYGDAEIRLLAGCAPCQPFSTYSQRGRADRGGDDWKLVRDFGRLIQETKPELVTMENVPMLLRHPVFEEFQTYLKGYHVTYEIVNCTDYGLAQTRKRLVLLASRLGKVHLLSPIEFAASQRTLKDVIGDLPNLEAGQTDPTDPLHTASRLSELNLRRIRAAKPGKTWREWEDQDIVAACHRKPSGGTFSSVYGRMEWNKPSPTITTQCFGFGNGRFGHPVQDRAISLREAALLQSFPLNYRFTEPGEKVSFSKLGRMIGNAVPVVIGELVGMSLIRHVEAYLARENTMSSTA